MKNLKNAIAVCVIGASGFALAHDNTESNNKNYYFQLNTGISHSLNSTNDFAGVDLNNSGIYGFAVGSKINDAFSADISMDYRPSFSKNYSTSATYEGINTTSNKNIKVKSFVTMINGYYNITTIDNNITPYITFGMGIANNKTNQFTIDSVNSEGDTGSTIYSKGKRTNFAWKIGAGTKFALNSQFDLDLRYQYADLGKFTTGNTESFDGGAYESTRQLKGNLTSHELIIGLGYKF